MRNLACQGAFLLVIFSLTISLYADEEGGSIQGKHIRQAQSVLLDTPTAFGRPIQDRNCWDTFAALPSWQTIIRQAEALLCQPIPEQSADLFLDYDRTGNRDSWQAVAGTRRNRIPLFTLAECLENKGRFLKPFEDSVREICKEPTWVFPAHDDELDNFYGRTIDIDLFSAMFAWQLATSDFLLNEKLSPELRTLIRENVNQRVLHPFRQMVLAQRPENNWLRSWNNWNAVCLAGVTGTALAILESKSDRAFFVEAARTYSRYYQSGYNADGYCTEGIGYWNFGFGNYVFLSELLYQASGGKIDLLEQAMIPAIARFGLNSEIVQGIYPNFSDCSFGAKPDSMLMNFLCRKFSLDCPDSFILDPAETNDGIGGFPQNLMYALPNSAAAPLPRTAADEEFPLRSWFDESGLLIGRPGPNLQCRLAVALKGGHNAEAHNHNDNGTFIVVAGKSPLIIDPGPEPYTKRTFSSRRYVSNVLNSYGHSVPVIAGKLQETGRHSRARLTALSLTPDSDTVQYDLTSSYAVPDLTKLLRTFIYSRLNAGTLTVIDEIDCRSPQTYQSALVSYSSWKPLTDDSFLIYEPDQAVRVTVHAEGSAFEILSEIIQDQTIAGKQPLRLAVNLKSPVTRAKIKLLITPDSRPAP